MNYYNNNNNPSSTPSTEQYYASRSASDSSVLTSSRRSNLIPSTGFRRLIPGSSELISIQQQQHQHNHNHNPSDPPTYNNDGPYLSPLKALTIHLADTYRLINPSFRYELSLNPRRVLTKPSKPAGNNGLDNEDSDYILYVNDILGGTPTSSSSSSSASTSHPPSSSSNLHLDHHSDPLRPKSSIPSGGTGHKYLILDVLGQGTFGQVVKCQDLKTHQVVAVKVIKNKQAYFSQSMMEVTILELLNNTWDPENRHHILRMKDTFIHHNHLCIVFELLSSNLYELIKQNSFRGLSTSLVRVFTNQLLDALTVLNEAHLIHCDLKPENILLTSLSSPEIKVIDFGSACHERQTVYTYIQSRFYRSPEVILGLPYSSGIDMWSLGCICVELFLGLPLFPGTSEYNQITRIVEMLGMPPTYMLEVGRQTLQFFDVMEDNGRKIYKLKSLEQYSKEHNVQEQPSKRYFQQNTLEDIISQYPVIRKGMKPADLEKEKQNRIAFIDFVKGLLNINPIERWSPQQARLHPFILGEPLREPYVPMKLNPISGSSSGADRAADLNQKRYSSVGHPPSNSQTSPQIGGATGSNESSVKRPYGGLPAAPVRSGQKVYDAAAYSQLQAQQQVINAQAAAMRQQQAHAAQQSQNPYALPSDNRTNLSQLSSQSNAQQQQTQNPSSNVALQMPSQYSSNRTTLSHATHPASLANPSSAAINIPHSYYPTTRGSSSTISGSLNSGSLPGPQMSNLMSQHQMMYNPILNPSGSSNTSANPGMASSGRQRSGTLDQMDMVPPQLQKVQVDLANYAGQSVTPVLRRDDQYLAWERRQQGGGTSGMTGNSGLTRRPSYRSNPQLDYLHEQAESNNSWSSAHQGQARYTHYQPIVNTSTRYMTTGTVPVPLPPASSSQQQSRSHPQNVAPNIKTNHSSFSVVVDDDYLGGGGGRTENQAAESTRTTTNHDLVPLDEYDHRDGGQAMAYLPIIPKPSSNHRSVLPNDGLINSATTTHSTAAVIDHHLPQHSHHTASFGRLMNLS